MVAVDDGMLSPSADDHDVIGHRFPVHIEHLALLGLQHMPAGQA